MAKKVKSPRKTVIPVYKIKSLMKSKPDINQVACDAAFMMTVAAELFVRYLAEEAFFDSSNCDIDYKDVAKIVHKDKKYQFLKEVIPQKITVREYKELLEKAENLISEEDSAFYLK